MSANNKNSNDTSKEAEAKKIIDDATAEAKKITKKAEEDAARLKKETEEKIEAEKAEREKAREKEAEKRLAGNKDEERMNNTFHVIQFHGRPRGNLDPLRVPFNLNGDIRSFQRKVPVPVTEAIKNVFDEAEEDTWIEDPDGNELRKIKGDPRARFPYQTIMMDISKKAYDILVELSTKNGSKPLTIEAVREICQRHPKK